MGDEALSYALIEKKIDSYAKDVAEVRPSRLERGATLASVGLLIAACIAAPFVKTLMPLRLFQVGLALCVIAMLVGFYCFVRREWHTFFRRNDVLSRELDHDYEQWCGIVAEMRRFPRTELTRRLRYLSARKSSFA